MGLLNILREKRTVVYDEKGNTSYLNTVKITADNIKKGVASSLQYVQGSKRLYDLGCGSMPYRKLFDGVVDEYHGFDFKPAADLHKPDLTNPSAWIDITDSDLKSESCDVVLSTQVLEHIGDTKKFIKEIHRVLEKGGTCIMTIPFAWPTHAEPDDFYRFTCFGLETLFTEAGFEIVKIQPLEGAYATIMQLYLVSVYGHTDQQHSIIKFIRKLQSWILTPILNYMALKLDSVFYNEKLCLNYLLIAKKK